MEDWDRIISSDSRQGGGSILETLFGTLIPFEGGTFAFSASSFSDMRTSLFSREEEGCA
jgi:hypothetical protein